MSTPLTLPSRSCNEATICWPHNLMPLIDALSNKMISASDMIFAGVCSDNMDMVKFALKADPTCDVSCGVSMACETGNMHALRILLKTGVKPKHEMMWAACRQGNLDVIQLLIDHGCEFTNVCQNICVRHGHPTPLVNSACCNSNADPGSSELIPGEHSTSPLRAKMQN